MGERRRIVELGNDASRPNTRKTYESAFKKYQVSVWE